MLSESLSGHSFPFSSQTVGFYSCHRLLQRLRFDVARACTNRQKLNHSVNDAFHSGLPLVKLFLPVLDERHRTNYQYFPDTEAKRDQDSADPLSTITIDHSPTFRLLRVLRRDFVLHVFDVEQINPVRIDLLHNSRRSV
jgi:hypothetical protein